MVEQRVVKNEHIWTSSGVSSGMDLALQFIAFIDGEDVAGKVQMFSEYFPEHRRYGNIARDEPKAPQYLRARL